MKKSTTEKTEHLVELNRLLISECSSKGLTKDETFIIGAMANCQDSIDRYGEEMAIKMAIEVIKLCGNDSELIFFAVEKALGLRD